MPSTARPHTPPARARWRRPSLQTLRQFVQLGVVGFIVVITGLHLTLGEESASPEAFCPFGGLETLYSYLTSGRMIDHTHLANLALFLAVVVTTIVARGAFCGWICPFGTIQEWIYAFSRWLQRRIPPLGRAMSALRKRLNPRAARGSAVGPTLGQRIDHGLSYGRYLVLAWFLGATIAYGSMVFRDADPWATLLHITTIQMSIGAVVLGVTLIASLFVEPADSPLLESDFLSSVREYREAGMFDTLVKMGPLRAWGWGSAPDAIVTAPRFQNLVQLVWSGTADDPGFGYDPVSSPVEIQEPSNGSRSVPSGVLGHCISRRPARVSRLGNFDFDAPGAAPDEDEFKLFQQEKEIRPGDKRRATLAVVDQQYGILYAPHSQILSYDPLAANGFRIQLRILGESLAEGMFVIMPRIGDVNLGADQANEGNLSRVWKQRLREEIQINREALCRILRLKGLDLQHLSACVENWAEPASTVIHAPQRRKHFEILINALAIDGRPVGGVDWWQLAWNEVRHSRGEAIQGGMHEHDIVEEQLTAQLGSLLGTIDFFPKSNTGPGQADTGRKSARLSATMRRETYDRIRALGGVLSNHFQAACELYLNALGGRKNDTRMGNDFLSSCLYRDRHDHCHPFQFWVQ